MPSYEYKCPSCGGEVDMFMSISEMESSEVPCPAENCDAIMEKQMSGPAVHMNGHEAVRSHKNKYGSDTRNVPSSPGNGVKYDAVKRKR